jgi:hypothetical protein
MGEVNKREQKKEAFLLMRMLGKTMSESMIWELMAGKWKEYQASGNKEDRPMMELMLLSLKWGDEEKDLDEDSIRENTDELCDIHDLHNEMKDIKDSLND